MPVNVYLYPTDPNWYSFLSRQPELDEVNFWRPGGEQRFNQLRPGDLLLFRLRSPDNAIAGGGTYTHFSFAPLAQVWDAFGIKNGTADYDSFLTLIARHKKLGDIPERAATSIIGCIVLSNPFFLPRDRWISVPQDYPVNSPQGYRYDATSGTGRYLLDAITEAARGSSLSRVQEQMHEPVLFQMALGRRRLGQGAFSLLVADAYEKRCAVSGERTYPVLEAAHILPVSRGGVHRVDNGLLLRSDIHKLFDKGYVTVTPSGEFRVSRHLNEEWHNGRIYYAFDKQAVRQPADRAFRPAKEFLEWHADTLFKG
jgi:putative restriction endonuclease